MFCVPVPTVFGEFLEDCGCAWLISEPLGPCKVFDTGGDLLNARIKVHLKFCFQAPESSVLGAELCNGF